MFTLNEITLRPVDLPDLDQFYLWHLDTDLEILSGWGPRRARHTYEVRFRAFLDDPPEDMVVFAVEFGGDLVGRIELAEIEREHRRGSVGLYVGEKSLWGKGIGSTALRIMLDYAFHVENLDRVWALVYDFNLRSRRLMEKLGFTAEGVLRGHEIHNGVPRDMHAYGILKHEFQQQSPNLFAIPDSAGGGHEISKS
ncbi:MAG: GNAT family protein [Acidobacteriota bacterium]|nr:GNAT family protein [Acidobacteriota bacterium]